MAELPPRKNLLALHPLAQRLLPLFVVDECRNTHDGLPVVDVQEVTDEEAAYFATLTLFQHDRFDRELGKLELSLKAGVVLSQLFGGPVHATLRRMVERSTRRCALLVIERVALTLFSPEKPYCVRRDFLLSEPFTTDFGRLCIPQELTAEWNFAGDLLTGCLFREDGTVVLNTANGFATFQYHFLSRDSLRFVFIIPQDERQFCSIKIELIGA